MVQDTNASGWEGSLASKAWKLLQLYLERYDVNGEYRRKVLSVILQEDRRIRLPKALVDWFMVRHPLPCSLDMDVDLLSNATGCAP